MGRKACIASHIDNIKILHSLRDDMVDCHPEETLSTEAEPRWTILSEG